MVELLLIATALLLVIFFGFPIFVAIGLIGLALFFMEGHEVGAYAQIINDHLNSNTLTSIPFFIIATAFIEHGKAGRALIRLADAILGAIRGGLGLACIFAGMVFSAISGSSTATALALGAILIPAMSRRQYPSSFAHGVIGASGTLGILIPPSVALIVYGYVASTSVPRLFLGGILPALLQASLFAAWVLYSGTKTDLPQKKSITQSEFLQIFKEALPALAMPVLVLGGIYSGIVTVTEAAALAAILSMAVGLFIYKDCTVEEVPRIVRKGMETTARVMIIVAMSFGFSHWIISSELSKDLVEIAVSNDIKPWMFLLLMNLVMLLMGAFLEVISVILITLPIVYPMLGPLGIDPVHYAMIVIVNMQIATLTPPVGLTLFALSSTSDAPFSDIVKGVIPYIFLLLISLIVISAVPALSLTLPNLVFGG